MNFIKVLKKKLSIVLNPTFWIWFTPLLLIVPNIVLSITEFNSIPAKITNVFLPLGIYYFLFSLSKRAGRTLLLFIPLMVFAAFQIVLLFLYGESIIAIDMYVNIMTTSVSEATELLGNLTGAILVILILYLPPIFAGIYFAAKHKYVFKSRLLFLRKISYCVLIVGFLSFFVTIIFVSEYKPHRELFPYNVIDNMVTAIRRTNESMHYHNTSRAFTYSPVMTRDKDVPEVYVFVIGETGRAENWQIFGYDSETNPLLSKRKGIYEFGKAVTEINTTHKAVPMLLSYLTPENFGDSVAHTKSIFSAFNNLGYRTAFISNQRRNHSYIDYYGEEAQLSTFIADEGGPLRDFNLIGHMKEILENSPNHKVFITLHSYGSHFEYRKRYPSEMAYFTPDNNSTASRANRSQLMNAYNNTIRYTDALLDSVIGTLDNLNIPAAMIYVSDHGEDIFDDDRERFLHSSPTPTFYQVHVPMIIWLSEEFNEQYPQYEKALRDNANKNISSTSSVFHTILDISGIHSPFYDATYSVASPLFKERERKYLNDYNESVSLRKSGLRKEDFEVFKKKNISL